MVTLFSLPKINRKKDIISCLSVRSRYCLSRVFHIKRRESSAMLGGEMSVRMGQEEQEKEADERRGSNPVFYFMSVHIEVILDNSNKTLLY